MAFDGLPCELISDISIYFFVIAKMLSLEVLVVGFDC